MERVHLKPFAVAERMQRRTLFNLNAVRHFAARIRLTMPERVWILRGYVLIYRAAKGNVYDLLPAAYAEYGQILCRSLADYLHFVYIVASAAAAHAYYGFFAEQQRVYVRPTGNI